MVGVCTEAGVTQSNKVIERVSLAAAAALVPPAVWLIVVDGPLAALPPDTERALRIFLAIAIATVISLVAVVHWMKLVGSRAPGPPVVDNPPDDGQLDAEIQDSLRLVTDNYDPNAFSLFGELLLNPLTFTRAYDRAEVVGQLVVIRTSIDYAVNRNQIAAVPADQPLPVPVVEPEKGRMLDAFEVTDGDDTALSALPQSEACGLLAHLVIMYFARAYGRPFSVLYAQPTRPPELRRMIRMIFRKGRLDRNSCNKEFADAASTLPTPVNPFDFERLRAVCTYYGRHYLIAVETRTSQWSRLHLRYQQIFPVQEDPGPVQQDPGERWRNRLRARLGLVPLTFVVPIPSLYRAGSYHFTMSGIAAHYVLEQYIFDLDTRNVVRQGDLRTIAPRGYFRLRHHSTLAYARAYGRGFNGMPRGSQPSLATVVQFAEVPPGALGGSVKVLAVAAALVTVFAFRPARDEATSDAAALLLAAPAGMAAWVGHSIDQIRQSSLATYVGLGVAQFVSVCAALLYILERRMTWLGDRLKIEDQRLLGFIELPLIDSGWAGLSVVSLCLLGVLWMMKIRDTSRYLERMK